MTFSREPKLFGDQSAVAFVEGRENPRSITIDKSRIAPDSKGKVVVECNSWIAEITPGYFGVLPRAKVTQAFTTTSATGKVGSTWRYLKPGDALKMVLPHLKLTFTNGWAANDSFVLTVDGAAKTFTFQAINGTSTANVTEESADFINNQSVLRQRVTAIAAGADLFLFSQEESTRQSVAVSSVTTAGAGDVTITGPGGTPDSTVPEVSIGTIQAISNDGTIILTGNAAVPVPVGASVGIEVRDIIGLLDYTLDMTFLDRYNVGPLTAARGIYTQLLSYFDADIHTRFKSSMIFSEKF